ncbi:hypothetical protein CL629_01710 [bacterium]|nr:hypothetical protein [bacterium]|tara:strand:- start:591 stop:872 length:282 start_codon:yes stop_codon:yes gene_type:complete
MEDKKTDPSAKAEKKLWFKARSFGWGWTPVSKEGWLVTIIYMAALLFIGIREGNNPNAESQNILIPVGLLTALLIIIALKTGEKPSWRWSKPR